MKKRINKDKVINYMLVFFVLIILICIGIYSFNKFHSKSVIDTENISNVTQQVTMNELEKKINSKETFVVYIGRNDCSDCNLFEPGFKTLIVDKKIQNRIFYLDVKEIHNDEAKWSDAKKEIGIEHTPALVSFLNGNLDSVLQWTTEDKLKLSTVSAWLDRKL